MNTTKEAINAIKIAFHKGYRVAPNGDIISPKGDILNGCTRKRCGLSYKTFGVRVDGKVTHIPVHRFVAYLKYGELGLTSDCVRHLDGNSTNNSLENIEIGTHRDNMLDIPKEIRVKRAKHASSFIVVYNDEMVCEIKRFHDKTNSYKQTMNKFGITSKATLHNILHNR